MDKSTGIPGFVVCADCGVVYKIKDAKKGIFECLHAGWIMMGSDIFSEKDDAYFLCPKCSIKFKKEVLDVGELIEV